MQLDTIAIVSPKDPNQHVLINVQDFNPQVHTKWDERVIEPVPAHPMELPVEALQDTEGEMAKRKYQRRNIP